MSYDEMPTGDLLKLRLSLTKSLRESFGLTRQERDDIDEDVVAVCQELTKRGV